MEETNRLPDRSETPEPLHQEEVPSSNNSSGSHPGELDKLLPETKTIDEAEVEVPLPLSLKDSDTHGNSRVICSSTFSNLTVNIFVYPESNPYTQSQYQIFEEVITEVGLDVTNGIKESLSKESNQAEGLHQAVEKLSQVATGTAGAETDLTSENHEDKLAKYFNSLADTDQLAQNQHHCEDVAEVKSFTIALLELAFEKQTDIASAATSTLQSLGQKHPATVLRVLIAHLSGSFHTFYIRYNLSKLSLKLINITSIKSPQESII